MIRDSRYSRLPVFRDDIDEIGGIVRVKDIIRDLAQGTLTKSTLTEKTREPYYVPEGTPLNKQLANFQRLKHRLAFVVDASSNIRQLNRLMNWDLPTDGPKTLNGLIVERLETIPESGTGLTVALYPIEILDTTEHAIKKVRVSVPKRTPESQ